MILFKLVRSYMEGLTFIKWHCFNYVLACILLLLHDMRSCESLSNVDNYIRRRSEFITKEKQLMTGGHIKLTSAEADVNNTLMIWKMRDIVRGHDYNGTYFPAIHFFKARDLIGKSPIYSLIRKMPKGGALHVHEGSMGNIMWLIKNATYDLHCYMCYRVSDNQLLFHFFRIPPVDPDCPWKSVMEERKLHKDPEEFDKYLQGMLTMTVSEPEKVYHSEKQAWAKFQSIFNSVMGLIYFAPVFDNYFMRCFQEFYDDNVQYIEMRSLFLETYDLDVKQDAEFTMKTYVRLIEEFKRTHPDFSGAKIIYTSSRVNTEPKTIREAVQLSMKLYAKYPRYFAGYDLVGYENSGNSLLYYIDELLYPASVHSNLPYFFHAGETYWEDSDADENLIDAILLNTTRIGHGYSIAKHPMVVNAVLRRKIPVEICPVSNQVLMLVDDLRNHPASYFLSAGHPVVISSDDPGLWLAEGLSYDFYEAFMGLGGRWSDLATLKQLAINSIKYSSMGVVEKRTVLNSWEEKWKKFIDGAAQHLSCSRETTDHNCL